MISRSQDIVTLAIVYNYYRYLRCSLILVILGTSYYPFFFDIKLSTAVSVPINGKFERHARQEILAGSTIKAVGIEDAIVDNYRIEKHPGKLVLRSDNRTIMNLFT